MKKETAWSIQQARKTYAIDLWGTPFFDINQDGEIIVSLPGTDGDQQISLKRIADEMVERGVPLPLILRFSDILVNRLNTLNQSFTRAIASSGYQGVYRGVFPVKVNQQHQVIEEVTDYGQTHHHGLEVGSKAELLVALTYMHDQEALIVCNGYKDEEFIDLALYSRKMGLNTILVVEMASEIPLIIERSRHLGIAPALGIRSKLGTPGSGYWLESAGDLSVFGLNAAQLMAAVDTLKEAHMLDTLVMLHYHLGSQITDIQTVRSAAEEATRIYVGLVREGAPMGYLDIGGGLAIDYDGTQSNNVSSRNYSINEYCEDLLEVLKTRLDLEGIPHPTLVSESGRYIVAHYAVLLFNVLENAGEYGQQPSIEVPKDAHQYTRFLSEIANQVTSKNLLECYNDAIYYRDQLRTMFLHDVISLRERGLSELFFTRAMKGINEHLQTLDEIPVGLKSLPRSQADVYYGNFSLFQSLPDVWAIDQQFPIMPIHRLNEKPSRQAVIADITCDCDGKLDRFITKNGTAQTLPLHPLNDQEPYIIGAFLIGAYQETLGDLHNLLGDTNVVSVRLDEEGELEFCSEVQGDTVADVLSYVEYDLRDMRNRFTRFVERAVRKGALSPKERKELMYNFEQGLQGYTYFET